MKRGGLQEEEENQAQRRRAEKREREARDEEASQRLAEYSSNVMGLDDFHFDDCTLRDVGRAPSSDEEVTVASCRCGCGDR